jgi:hypothetical protein
LRYELLIERRAPKQLAGVAQSDRDRIVAAVRGLAEEPRPVRVKKHTGAEKHGALVLVATGSSLTAHEIITVSKLAPTGKMIIITVYVE